MNTPSTTAFACRFQHGRLPHCPAVSNANRLGFARIRRHWVALLICMLCLNGCATQGHSPASPAASSVSADLSGKILPELTQKLATLPKFKGQHIAVIADSQGTSGGMLSVLQKQIVSELLKVDGITLMNGSFPELAGITMEDCFNWQNADIVLVLSEKRHQGSIRLSIRALDPQDKSRYLSGISYDLDYNPVSLAGAESAASLHETVFEASDLAPLADRLAADLYCGLMKRNQLPLILNAQVATPENALPLTRALSLRLLQRLGDLQQISLSHTAPHIAANLALELTPGLPDSINRLTATLNAADGKLLLAGVSVRLPAAVASGTPVESGTPVVSIQPVSSSNRPATTRVNPAQAVFPVLVAEQMQNGSEILQFDIVVPTDLAHCAGSTPWRSGERPLHQGEVLSANACFALSLGISPGSQSMIVYKDTDDTLVQLVPANCSPKVRTQVLSGRLQLRFPDPASDYPAIDLGRETGTEGFYVITASKDDQPLLQSLVQNIPTLCDRPAGQNSVAVPDFNQRLQVLKSQNPQRLDWRYSEFEHR